MRRWARGSRPGRAAAPRHPTAEGPGSPPGPQQRRSTRSISSRTSSRLGIGRAVGGGGGRGRCLGGGVPGLRGACESGKLGGCHRLWHTRRRRGVLVTVGIAEAYPHAPRAPAALRVGSVRWDGLVPAKRRGSQPPRCRRRACCCSQGSARARIEGVLTRGLDPSGYWAISVRRLKRKTGVQKSATCVPPHPQA